MQGNEQLDYLFEYITVRQEIKQLGYKIDN